MTKEELTEAAKAEQRAYYKKWRAEHKAEIKASNARYWENSARKRLEQEAAENDR